MLFQPVESLATRSSVVRAEFQKLPFVGIAKRSQVTFIVVGTSHFQCNSASEINSLVRELKPDGVVVELDPERAVRLTKEAATSDSAPWFGADFLAAIDAAREIDVPLFIGDEYTRDTRARFLDTLLSPASYSPQRLMASVFRSNAQIDLLQTFAQDPMKLTPLVTVIVTPLVIVCTGFLLQGRGVHFDIGSLRSNVSACIALVLSFLCICKVYNTLIVDRDDVIIDRAINAAEVITSLKRKETIRRRWTFSTEPNTTKSQDTKRKGIPLFTLKRPLKEDEIRRLHLFEPRWLSMIDSLQTAGGIFPAQFGCLTCVNKFYCSIALDGKEGKYADVIFKRRGRMASLENLIEGTRPSGDRKVTAEIEGKNAFTLDEKHIFVADEGYLMTSGIAEETCPIIPANICDEDVSIIVVVGLLHANGVVDQLCALN